jgi:[protein-PII] uridylyltransferase
LRVPLSRAALDTLAARTPPSSGPWTDRTRSAFVSLLGAGEPMVPVIESLDHVGLLSRYLPQWRHVRSLPQRNAFHTYTVDRHLLVTVANATALVRTVHRPDLLLVGALLHDIGKGQPGDHTEAGMKLVAEIAPHIGFPPDDVATLTAMVEHHLLLAETATRRDLADPKTAANVATAIGDPARLELLRALTEADSLATGPAAWSEWKRSLVDALVEGVAGELGGRPDRGDGVDVERRFAEPLEQVRLGGGVWAEHVAAGEYEQFRIATKDRPGLFAQAAGVLALNRADVFGAEAWTSDDGIAIAQFDILPTGGEPLSFERVQQDLVDAIAGRLDVAARVAARIESAASAHRRAVAAAAPITEVFVSNQASDSTTLIDVRVPDAPGVLYRLSAALADFGVTIRSAKVATLGHEVVDAFYVQRKGRTPRQLTPGEADQVRTVLLAAIAPGDTPPDPR